MKSLPFGRHLPTGPDIATRVSLDHMIALRGAAGRRPAMRRGITPLPGLANTRLRGQGLDFDELHPYAEGDDVRHIDWNVTARTGRPHTRLYREERERAVTVCVDLRRSMFTGSLRLKAVLAAEIAAVLLWSVVENGDRASAMTVDDRSLQMSRPALREPGVLDGLALVDRVFQAGRSTLHEQPTGTLPLDAVIADINGMRRHGGAFVLISDCAHLGDKAAQELATAGLRRRLVVLRLVDPLELTGLPVGNYAYRVPGGSKCANIDGKTLVTLNEALRMKNEQIAAAFSEFGIPYLAIPTTIPPSSAWSLLNAHDLL